MDYCKWFTILVVLITALLPLVEGQCVDSTKEIMGRSGEIKSPNFPDTEYGKAANCSWNFSPLPDGNDYALVLTEKQLRLYVVLASNKKRCLGSYNLRIDDELSDCEKYAAQDQTFCKVYFSSPICINISQDQKCEREKETSYPVPVKYFSDGRIDNTSRLRTNTMHFNIGYKFIKCPKAQGYSTTTTTPHAYKMTTVAPTKFASSSAVPTTELKSTSIAMTVELTTIHPNTSSAGGSTETPTSPTGISNKPSTDHWTASRGTTGTKTTTTQRRSQMIIIIAASTGGGGLILIFVIVLVVCLCKRRGREKIEEDQTIPLDDKTTAVDQSDGATSDTLGAASGANQSDGATYDTIGGATEISQPGVTGVSQSEAATYDSLNVAGAANQSGNETYDRVGGAVQTNQSNEPAGAVGTSEAPMYATVGVAAEINQSQPELYSTVFNHPEVTPSGKSQEEGALYSAVSIRKRGEKETVHYKKTTVDNILYGTTEHKA